MLDTINLIVSKTFFIWFLLYGFLYMMSYGITGVIRPTLVFGYYHGDKAKIKEEEDKKLKEIYKKVVFIIFPISALVIAFIYTIMVITF